MERSDRVRDKFSEREHSFEAHENQHGRYRREEGYQRIQTHEEPVDAEYQRSRSRGDRSSHKESFQKQQGPSSEVDDFPRSGRRRIQDNEQEDYPSTEDRDDRFKDYQRGQEKMSTMSRKSRK